MSKCSFRSDWMDNPEFHWLREVPDDKRMAFCFLCKQKFSLSNMGLQAINSHQKGKKHQLREKGFASSKSLKNVFAVKNVSSSDCSSKNSIPSTDDLSSLPSAPAFQPNSPPDQQMNIAGKTSQASTIEKYLFKENVTRAEILWCLEAVTTHKSLRSAEKDVKLFPKLFPDSDIAMSMHLGRDKMAYTIVYGIAPYFKEQLEKDLVDCTHFVVGFDESINKVAQKQQMDLNVRFWCTKTNRVKTRYFNSAFLGRSRSSDLLSAFKSAIQPLNLKKVVQVSMDGPNVNLKFFKELTDSLKETPEDSEMLNIGSCGLHTVNVAFKAGATAAEWNLFDFHRSLYYLFKDSPARRALFTHYTNSEVFPLKFCSVRWLENCRVTERAINLIPNIKIFIDAVEKDKVAPTCKSYSVIKRAVSDDMLPAKLAFFHMVAADMESFLREYQTDAPLVPFLYVDLCSLTYRLMERFIKKDIVKKNLSDIDLNDTNNFLTFKQVDIGISAQCQLRKLKKVSDSQINTFRNDCRTFLIHCARKLKDRSPLIYELTKMVSCFDPRVCVLEKVFCKRLTKLLLILCTKNWVNTTVADRAKAQLKEICSRPHIISKLKSYKRQDKRIDQFWYNILMTEENCEDAVLIIKLIMILSHGNANIERGFSINSDCLWENMKEESLVARRIVYDSILANGELKDFEISKQLVLHARNARSKFAEAKEIQKEETKRKNAESKMKRDTDLELKKLQNKKAQLLEDAQKESYKIDEEIAALQLLQKKK